MLKIVVEIIGGLGTALLSKILWDLKKYISEKLGYIKNKNLKESAKNLIEYAEAKIREEVGVGEGSNEKYYFVSHRLRHKFPEISSEEIDEAIESTLFELKQNGLDSIKKTRRKKQNLEIKK